MDFIKRHKIATIILALLVSYVGFNLWQERSVLRVSQEETPDVQTVEMQSQPEITEEEPSVDTPAVFAKGSFVDGRGTYKGSGSLTILPVDDDAILKFEEDFDTTNGPDLVVYLSPNASPKDEGLGDFVSLGELKEEKGSQTYTLPDNWKDFKSVVVWCRAFRGVFTQATVELAS